LLLALPAVAWAARVKPVVIEQEPCRAHPCRPGGGAASDGRTIDAPDINQMLWTFVKKSLTFRWTSLKDCPKKPSSRAVAGGATP